MRKHILTPGALPPFVRALVAGTSSSGKTSFVATAPKPLIIGDEIEAGFNTLYSIDPALLWDGKTPPEVWAIQNIKDIGPMLVELEKLAQGGKFPWKTVVLDPVSLYTDRVLFEMGENGKKSDGTKMDGRELYGDLATHLYSIIRRFHALPAHVIWCSHVNPGTEESTIAVGGQMAHKFPAYCDFKWFTNVNTIPGRPPIFELRTQPFRTFKFLGCRYGQGRIPDPCIPSFKVIAQQLGLPEQPPSPAVPGYPMGVTYGPPPGPPPSGPPAVQPHR